MVAFSKKNEKKGKNFRKLEERNPKFWFLKNMVYFFVDSKVLFDFSNG